MGRETPPLVDRFVHASPVISCPEKVNNSPVKETTSPSCSVHAGDGVKKIIMAIVSQIWIVFFMVVCFFVFELNDISVNSTNNKPCLCCKRAYKKAQEKIITGESVFLTKSSRNLTDLSLLDIIMENSFTICYETMADQQNPKQNDDQSVATEQNTTQSNDISDVGDLLLDQSSDQAQAKAEAQPETVA